MFRKANGETEWKNQSHTKENETFCPKQLLVSQANNVYFTEILNVSVKNATSSSRVTHNNPTRNDVVCVSLSV
jgi:hypothetical protein